MLLLKNIDRHLLKLKFLAIPYLDSELASGQLYSDQLLIDATGWVMNNSDELPSF